MSGVAAADLLSRLDARYGSCAAYEDTGRLVLFASGASAAEEKVVFSFRTVFVRSQGLFFECREGQKTVFAIRCAQGRVVAFKFAGKDAPARTVADAVATLTGVTFGVAHNVARLLLPHEVGGRAITDVADARLAGPQTVSGRRCMVVELESAPIRKEVSIDEVDLTIRRVLLEFAIGPRHGMRDLRDAHLSAAGTTSIVTYAPTMYVKGVGEMELPSLPV